MRPGVYEVLTGAFIRRYVDHALLALTFFVHNKAIQYKELKDILSGDHVISCFNEKHLLLLDQNIMPQNVQYLSMFPCRFAVESRIAIPDLLERSTLQYTHCHQVTMYLSLLFLPMLLSIPLAIAEIDQDQLSGMPIAFFEDTECRNPTTQVDNMAYDEEYTFRVPIASYILMREMYLGEQLDFSTYGVGAYTTACSRFIDQTAGDTIEGFTGTPYMCIRHNGPKFSCARFWHH